MLKLSDIQEISKCNDGKSGYYIHFNDGRKIYLTKKRTIIALLILIHKGEGTESDISQGNKTINEIRKIIEGKYSEDIIQDYYGDANKPYSELWNEEGFTFISNLAGAKFGSSKRYILSSEDHEKLFQVSRKANRKQPSVKDKDTLRKKQGNKCNLCGSILKQTQDIQRDTYAKDRRREVFDHRFPVEKGGGSELENYQVLCFYCNKCKWQICNICRLVGCDENCALRFPEKNHIIAPTQEDINDLIPHPIIDN